MCVYIYVWFKATLCTLFINCEIIFASLALKVERLVCLIECAQADNSCLKNMVQKIQ